MAIKFDIINDNLCITVDAIIPSMGIREKSALNTVWTGLKRNRQDRSWWKHYQDESDKRKKWIVVSSIPGITRERIEHYYGGDLWLAYWTEKLEIKVESYTNINDVEFFSKKGIIDSYFDDLVEACGWLRMLSDNCYKEHFKTSKQYHERAVGILAVRELYGLRVSNWRTLVNRVKKWKEIGLDSMINGRYGNKTAQKLSDMGKKFLIEAYSRPTKLNYTEVHKLYVNKASEHGWIELSLERVRQILSATNVQQLTSKRRDGSDSAKNRFERNIKRRKPSFSDAMWSFDGTTLQLLYKDSDGKIRNNLYVIYVMDVNSDKIVGYALGRNETANVVLRSLKKACYDNRRLPWQLQYDNSSANKSGEVTQLLSKMAKLSFPTAPYNGKSKPIENLIGRLERLNMRHFKNFKGGNITSQSLSIKANPDYLKYLKKNDLFPTEDQVIAQLELMVEVHNEKKNKQGTTPNERYAKMHDKVRRIDYMTMVELFWVERKRTVRYTTNGLQMEVDKQRYTYEVEARTGVEDVEFRKSWLGHNFTVKYDPDDLEYIMLFDKGKFMADAKLKYEMPMTQFDNIKGEGEVIKDSLEERKKYWQAMDDELEQIGKDLDEAGALSDLDYRELHKDEFNRIQEDKLNDLLNRTGMAPDKKPKKRYDMFDGDEADGRIIEED